jgi:hypothetical protein
MPANARRQIRIVREEHGILTETPRKSGKREPGLLRRLIRA